MQTLSLDQIIPGRRIKSVQWSVDSNLLYHISQIHSTEYGIGLSNDMLLFDKPVSKNGELGHHLDLIFAIYTFILDFLVDVKRLVSN